jgi:hypothetical protein
VNGSDEELRAITHPVEFIPATSSVLTSSPASRTEVVFRAAIINREEAQPLRRARIPRLLATYPGRLISESAVGLANRVRGELMKQLGAADPIVCLVERRLATRAFRRRLADRR